MSQLPWRRVARWKEDIRRGGNRCAAVSVRYVVGYRPPRSDVVNQPLRRRQCRECRLPFAVCASCDRGHAYCSRACRAAGRRRSVRAARARHQQSLEGRLDHRDRQRAYRARRRVTDHSSPRPRPSGTLPDPDEGADSRPTATRCVVCGRPRRRQAPLGAQGGAPRRADEAHGRTRRRQAAPGWRPARAGPGDCRTTRPRR